MARNLRTAAFKKKVVLEALREDKTMAQLASEYGVHPIQISQWKKQLLEKASEVFAKGKKSPLEPDVKELHAKIGRLTMENDFLAVALGRIDGSSAKK